MKRDNFLYEKGEELLNIVNGYKRIHGIDDIEFFRILEGIKFIYVKQACDEFYSDKIIKLVKQHHLEMLKKLDEFLWTESRIKTPVSNDE